MDSFESLIYFTHTHLQREFRGIEEKLLEVFPRNGGWGCLSIISQVSLPQNHQFPFTIQDISSSEFSNFLPVFLIVSNVPTLDSSNESVSEHKKFQQTSNEELILEDLPIEISANEPENQLKQMEHMLPASTSKLKVYLRKGKSTTSSHISSSNFLSSNENTHSSVYDDLYWPIAL